MFMYDLQVWSSLILSPKILDAIKDNDYDDLTKLKYNTRSNSNTLTQTQHSLKLKYSIYTPSTEKKKKN